MHRICPNGRIPAIVDHTNDDFSVWESGAILLYLVKRFDHANTLWSEDLKVQTQITSWIMLQVSGHGVIQGQAFWFKFFHSEYVESATRRYIEECRRVYGVLEVRLAEAREELWDRAEREDVAAEDLKDAAVWLVGDHMTIADLSYLTWARTVHRLDIDLEAEFPEVDRWVNQMLANPKVAGALLAPDLQAQQAHQGRQQHPLSNHSSGPSSSNGQAHTSSSQDLALGSSVDMQ